MADEAEVVSEFDFIAHRESAVAKYRVMRPLYEEFAKTAESILKGILDGCNVKYHAIVSRAKEVDHFGEKAVKPSESDPTKPKYANPLENIEDMAGVRVITYFPRTVEVVCSLIEQEFTISKKEDKSEKLIGEGKFGYQSVHFIVMMRPDRAAHSKYMHYSDLKLEIQVRTILQHAWAEMEHDIQYKSTLEIPALFQRRFIALAGLLEIADREFQMLQDENECIRHQKETKIKEHIANLRKSLAEGSTSDKEYAIEALKDLNLRLEREIK